MDVISPMDWISRHREPPVVYVAHPVAAQDGETLATCLECGAERTFMPTDVVNADSICIHDSPIRCVQDAVTIVKFNVSRALRWWRWLDQLEAAVWAMPWVTNVTANHGNEFDASRVERGLRDDCAIVRRCSALILVGPRVSRGMKIEAEAAHEVNLPVFRIEHPWTHGEPPAQHPASIPWRRYL